MKAIFYASAKPRELMLAESFRVGIEAAGHKFELRKTSDYGEDEQGNDRKWCGPSDDTDVAIFFGVKGISRQLMNDHLAVGRHTVFLDKGYTREKGEGGHTLFSRLAIDSGSPVEYMMDTLWPDDRLKSLRLKLAPRRKHDGGHILYASSSQKYNDFFGLGESSEVAFRTLHRMGKLSNRQLIYRPKPSDRRAKPIGGIALSTNSQSMADALIGCHVLVTYGSTAAMDAVVAGVPAIVLGDAIAAPVAQRVAEVREHVEKPYWPDDVVRHQWTRAVSYQQYSQAEMRSGEAWRYVLDQIVVQAKNKKLKAEAAAREAEKAAQAKAERAAAREAAAREAEAEGTKD